jgi:phosphatidylethanolamine/phosphatidyl-N-methylethanolamine N-methyltransferase
METSKGEAAKGLFFRRFLAHPSRVASLFPSSQALSRMIAAQVRRGDDEYVIELGAGTGTVTHAILSSGVPADKLIVVEIDKVMAQFLRKAYPTVTVLECSAFDIIQSLPQPAIGRVGCVVCGLPVTLHPLEWQQRLAEIVLSLLPRNRPFLVLTHRLASPILAKKIGLVGKRVGFTLRNFPPASVWAYARDAEISTCGLARQVPSVSVR